MLYCVTMFWFHFNGLFAGRIPPIQSTLLTIVYTRCEPCLSTETCPHYPPWCHCGMTFPVGDNGALMWPISTILHGNMSLPPRPSSLSRLPPPQPRPPCRARRPCPTARTRGREPGSHAVCVCMCVCSSFVTVSGVCLPLCVCVSAPINVHMYRSVINFSYQCDV